jgi:predicted dithiol-disulfide oxidoreductase (DUF899 family)
VDTRDPVRIEAEISASTKELAALKERLAGLRSELPETEVDDYVFASSEGEVRLSELFGDHNDLIVIHNMGQGCPYCTLWADGFIGLAHHIESRAAFVVSSPDDPATQSEFAAGRGWPFRMVSVANTGFTRDMGFLDEDGDYWPGYSTFRRTSDGTLLRVGKDFFGPGDDYCGVWPMFGLLHGGPGEWYPRFSYGE